MKKFKELILESRKMKPYVKYNQLLLDKYLISNIFDIDKVLVYEEDSKIYISFKVWDNVHSDFLDKIKYDLDDAKFKIIPNHGNQLTVKFRDISLDTLDMLFNTNKFNL
jgi:hypothetical protein